jgi:hypothetical protein
MRNQRKVERLNTIIQARVDLSVVQRDHLLTHLVEHLDDYDIPHPKNNFKLEYMMFHIHDEVGDDSVTEAMKNILHLLVKLRRVLSVNYYHCMRMYRV